MTVNRLMMELDMVLCDSSLHGDEEHEGLEDWLGMWANSGHRNALGQGNNYLVLRAGASTARSRVSAKLEGFSYPWRMSFRE